MLPYDTCALEHGISSSNQFWLVYLVNSGGEIVSPDVVLIANNASIEGQEVVQYLYTRAGHVWPDDDPVHGPGQAKPTRFEYGAPEWGWAFSGGNSRAESIRNWMCATNPDGVANAVEAVADLWNEEVADNFCIADWYLCLEDGLWCGYYIDKDYQGYYLASTAYGWAKTNYGYDMSIDYATANEKNGSWQINIYTNNILPNSVRLDHTQTAINAPTNKDGVKLPNRQIMNEGYGMAIFWVGEGDNYQTHTWDKTSHPTTEAKAPLPPSSSTSQDRIYTIVKSYRYKDAKGNLIDNGTFVKKQTVRSILIEDEPLNDTDKNYKVIEWRMGDSSQTMGGSEIVDSYTKKDNLSLSWEETIYDHGGKSSGTSKGSVALDIITEFDDGVITHREGYDVLYML